MAMLDAFFNRGFKGAKCKTMLKLTIPRIKLLRNRREIQLKHMRKDIAKLIESGQEATARIRVEHIIREENMMAAQEILELFCELISVRLPIIETQRECPLDLKEAISSICFAAPRCADLPELQQVQMLFAVKYGKDFVAAATELMPDCGVNRQIIELLSIRAPSVEAKMKLLKEIAEEHGLDWDPSASEAELLKPYDDLLNGPNHFTNGSTVPLPIEKHDNLSSTSHVNESNVESDSDADSLDLPEVPVESVRAGSDIPSAPGIISHVSPSQPHDFGPHVPPTKPENSNVAGARNKQFVPFVIPTSSTFPAPDGESESATSPPLARHLETQNLSKPADAPLSHSETNSLQDNKSVPPLQTDSVFSSHLNQIEPSSLISPSISPRKQSESDTSRPSIFMTSYQNDSRNDSAAFSFSRRRSEINTDLQDVLAAAMAAAETAESAAAAARAAASLAEVKIADFVTKGEKTTSESPDTEFHPPSSLLQPITGKQIFDHQDSFSRDIEEMQVMESKLIEFDNSPQSVHAPQRLRSLEDDPYFSYPNLFSSTDVDGKSRMEDPSSHNA